MVIRDIILVIVGLFLNGRRVCQDLDKKSFESKKEFWHWLLKVLEIQRYSREKPSEK